MSFIIDLFTPKPPPPPQQPAPAPAAPAPVQEPAQEVTEGTTPKPKTKGGRRTQTRHAGGTLGLTEQAAVSRKTLLGQ